MSRSRCGPWSFGLQSECRVSAETSEPHIFGMNVPVGSERPLNPGAGIGWNSLESTHKKRSDVLLCCKLYISESRNRRALDSIERAARLEPDAVIAKMFPDRAYNRVRYTLVSYVVHDSMPIFLYGAAHPTEKTVEAIRRELDYFRPNFLGSYWSGWSMPETLPMKPDVGPDRVSPARGVTMIGARAWVSTYNVPILSTDVSVVRRIARAVSERGGGLPTVLTLGLVHGEDSTEITCMLLEPNQVGADRVESLIQVLAAQNGLDVDRGYFTDLSPEVIVQSYMNAA
ncbi:hypothetical protein SAY87_030725 [Trapa incisa]|uniref:Formiminotransferase N-terminal subdomain domain-containing protein n=1 Tax=Trapa incisa TaxID=236973 RepID=A0AAN7QMB6_9MYRT|nr:hypothetical protein SAY87_030725 [Trapa incisa]